MLYPDGMKILAGDLVAIDGQYRGTVVASIDAGSYLPGEESWAYLGSGVMVRTNFAGLVHYTTQAHDELVLLERGSLAGRT